MIELISLQASNPGMDMLTNYGLLMVMIIVIWWFFLRPQAKKQKDQGKFLEELKKGDMIATSGGIIGRVNKIDGLIITIETGKTFVTVTKGSISKEMSDGVNETEDDK
jgi:preprotein translocase subunit YajC